MQLDLMNDIKRKKNTKSKNMYLDKLCINDKHKLEMTSC